jgi:hypothetical protein
MRRKGRRNLVGGEPIHASNDGRSIEKAFGKGSKQNSGKHFAREFLKREKINAIDVGDGDEDTTDVNHMRVLSG